MEPLGWSVDFLRLSAHARRCEAATSVPFEALLALRRAAMGGVHPAIVRAQERAYWLLVTPKKSSDLDGGGQLAVLFKGGASWMAPAPRRG